MIASCVNHIMIHILYALGCSDGGEGWGGSVFDKFENDGVITLIPYITRCTRGVRVVFSVTRMRSSNSARMNKSDFTNDKIV